jgi:hypothetical protein
LAKQPTVMYMARVLFQNTALMLLSINLIPYWAAEGNNAWRYRRLIWGLRVPLDVITTVTWLTFLWNGASHKALFQSKPRAVIMAFLLVTDILITVLIVLISGVFSYHTFNLNIISTDEFVKNGEAGIIRFLCFCLFCVQTWIIKGLFLFLYYQRLKNKRSCRDGASESISSNRERRAKQIKDMSKHKKGLPRLDSVKVGE